jgi:hypothetical protein
MPMSTTERARVAGEARWAGTTPEQRREAMRKAKIASAVRTIVDQAPALSDTQRTKLHAILTTPTPEGGGRDG